MLCAAEDLKDGVVDQIAAWLAMSPAQRSRHMAQLLKEVELDDMAHPAYARFKQVYEPLGLRDKERGLKFRKVCAALYVLSCCMRCGKATHSYSDAYISEGSRACCPAILAHLCCHGHALWHARLEHPDLKCRGPPLMKPSYKLEY